MTLHGIDYEGNPVTLECRSIGVSYAYGDDDRPMGTGWLHANPYYATAKEAREGNIKQLREAVLRTAKENFEAGEQLLKLIGLDEPKPKLKEEK